MLSTSRRHDSAYTLTARLMGDPRPDREALSDKIRASVRYSPYMPDGKRKQYDRVPRRSRAMQCVQAVADGYSTVQTISEALGSSYRTTGDCMSQAAKSGLVKVSVTVPSKGGGRLYVYAITDAGLKELERVK